MYFFFLIIISYLILFIIFPYKTLHLTARSIGNLIFRKKSIGYQIPKTGGALLIANHVSHLDFILVSIATKRKVYFVMYDKIYYHKSVHWILKRLSAIPISPSRNGEKSNLVAFNKNCQDIINGGDIVVIYPEGTVSRNGHLLEFKKGMEHIASGINAPIIPMHVFGANGSPFTFSIQENKFNKFRFKNLRKRIIINIGKPLSNSTSAFLARQKVLELIAENAFYSHSNQFFNFSNAILKRKNAETVFINGELKVLVKELKESTFMFVNQLTKLLSKVNQVIVSCKDELTLIKSILALSNLGKQVILLDPKSTNEEKEALSKSINAIYCISDYEMNFNKEAIIINPQTFNLTKTLGVKFKTSLPFFMFKLMNIRKVNTSSFQFPNFSQKEFELDEVTLTNINAFTESISNTHNISNYGITFNLKETYSPIGFLTKIALPIMTEVSTIINVSNNEKVLDKANSLIGEQLQIETLYNNTSREIWKHIKNIITDLELAEEINVFAKLNNIKIYKASGIEGIIGLLSINTPDYEGKDIAGKQLKQDGNNPTTFGRPVQGIAVKIVSKENGSEPLEANKEGKILIKGPLIMQPTHNSPFNWIDVNLNGYLTPEGYLQILD